MPGKDGRVLMGARTNIDRTADRDLGVDDHHGLVVAVFLSTVAVLLADLVCWYVYPCAVGLQGVGLQDLHFF